MIRFLGFCITVVLLAVLAGITIQHPIALLLAPVIGYGSAHVWLPEQRWRLRQLWRKLRGRCPMCGGRWIKKPPSPLDLYSYAPTCRSCAKTLLGGTLYGAGPARLRKICEE